MKHRLIILAWALIISLSAGAWSQHNYVTEYSVSEHSQLWVEGTSTIHSWKCEAHNFTGTLEIDFAFPAAPVIVGSHFVVPVADLDCKNRTQNKKMLKALASETSPNILFKLDNADVSSTETGIPVYIDVDGILIIAGQTRRVSLPGISIDRVADGFELSGSFKIHMSDFGIKPQTAFLGILKTLDHVEVHFDIFVLEEKESI
ncbi:MAG: YceI family protein [Bacteroidetes bacterium]|nr:YceI family protein [Bacteroidota bacterium]